MLKSNHPPATEGSTEYVRIGHSDAYLNSMMGPSSGGNEALITAIGGWNGSAPEDLNTSQSPVSLSHCTYRWWWRRWNSRSVSRGTTTPGHDELVFDDNENNVNGLDGDDRLTGLGGNDNLYGGLGNDFINGNTGNDYVQGNQG